MNENRVQLLFVYLDKLRDLQASGVHKYSEIEQVVNEINGEFGLAQKQSSGSQLKKPIDISRHIENHPLIAWNSRESQPAVKGTDITVRSLLIELVVGKTIHQLCGDYDLDINQVSGAVTFAAYVVSDGVYSDD